MCLVNKCLDIPTYVLLKYNYFYQLINLNTSVFKELHLLYSLRIL